MQNFFALHIQCAFFCIDHTLTHSSNVHCRADPIFVMEQVVRALSQADRYTLPDGEEWRKIAFPLYRPSKSARAWKYVSSWGRLLADDLRVGQATPGKGYFQTTLSIQVDGACGGMATVAAHRIVAFTFLGPPPSPFHTVDHLDRTRENNRVDNLAWVDPHKQLANREASSYVLRVQGGPTFTTLSELGSYVGLPAKTLSSLLRQASPGDTFAIHGTTFCVEEVVRKKMAPPSVSYPSNPHVRPREGKRRTVALQLACDGVPVRDIAGKMAISTSTVLAYLGQASREADATTLRRLASTLGLEDPETRRLLRDQLATLSQDPPLTPEAFADAYRRIVEGLLSPDKVAEWKAIRQTFRSICTMLLDG
jgi:hypothetical protein